jgi:hypothetical protein
MSLQESPAALRRRLMNPPNAVKDDGIDLRKHLRPAPAPVLISTPAAILKEKGADPKITLQRFDRACLRFFIWQCTPVRRTTRSVAKRNRNPPAHVTMAYILRVVAEHFGITVDGLKSEQRSRYLAHPRQIAYWLCRKLTDNSLPQIAKFMRKKDHTTVWHGIERIERERHFNLQLANTMALLLSQLSLPPVKNENISEIVPTTPDQISFVDTSVASVLRSTSLENSDADDQTAVPA